MVTIGGVAITLSDVPPLGAGTAPALSLDTSTLDLSSSSIEAHSSQSVEATLTASNLGLPANGLTVTFATNGDAQLSPSSCTTRGQGSCGITITAGSTYGEQTITATVTGLLYSATAETTLLQYDPPAHIAVALANTRLTPNGVASTTATATVTDAAGHGVPAQEVVVSTSQASHPLAIGQVTDERDGTYTATVTAPSSIASPDPRYAMTAALASRQVVTASLPSAGLTASTSLRLADPTFHTVQYPAIEYPIGHSGQPPPGLYDDQGRRLSLRGVEAPSGSTALGGPEPTMFSEVGGSPVPNSTWESEIDHMASPAVSGAASNAWGLNVVRIPLTDSYWLSADTADGCGAPYIDEIDKLVNWITAKDMVADLDLHYVVDGYKPANSPPPSELPCRRGTVEGASSTGDAAATPGAPTNLPMADAEYAPTFWSEVAYRYGNPSSPEYDPLVMFDLYNEPDLNGMSSLQGGGDAVQAWQRGGWLSDSRFGTGYSYRIAGMDQLYEAVRSRAPTTPVIVSGVGSNLADPRDGSGPGFDLSPVVNGDPLSDTPSSAPVVIGDPSRPGTPGTDVIYSSHPYFDGNCSLVGTLSDGDEADLENLVAPVAQRYPVIFGEMGSNCAIPLLGANAIQYNITWAQDNGLVGYVVWLWAANGPSESYGILDCDPFSCPTGVPYEPDEYGTPVYSSQGSMLN